MRILITGAAGFVGYHLADRLCKQGHELVLVDNFALGQADAAFAELCGRPGVSFIQGNLEERTSWDVLPGAFERIYHLAAINSTKLFYEKPHEVLRSGILTLMHALEWQRDKNPSAKLMFTSSNEAYASALEAFGVLPLPTPENVPLIIADTYNPRWSYAGTKIIGELLCIHYAKAYGLRMSIVRPHNFYGPRSGHHVIPDLIARIKKHEDPFELRGADETRSFCYITDATEAMERIMESPKTDSGTYHIGSSTETTIADLAQAVFAACGWQPTNLIPRAGLPGSVKRRLPNVSKIKKDVDWEANTSLAQGLKDTVAWFNTHASS